MSNSRDAKIVEIFSGTLHFELCIHRTKVLYLNIDAWHAILSPIVTNIFIDYPLIAFSLSSALLQKMNFIDASL